MVVNSNEKGKRGEREFAEYLRYNFGVEARRGMQYSGGSESPDVVTSMAMLHFEVKRVEKLNLGRAMEQAEEDCGDKIPAVAHKRNRSPWLITIRACDLEDFCSAVKKGLASENMCS